MTPLKAIWFSGGKGTIGIVRAESDQGEIGYYIGTGDGMHEVIDVNNIAALGARFPDNAGDLLFNIKKGKK
jgi:hypothetical protein